MRVCDRGVIARPADQTVALRAAAGVTAAGIDVTWLACGDDATRTHAIACRCRPGPRGALRSASCASRSRRRRGQLQLGCSLVDTRMARAGSLATVCVDRVHWVASQAAPTPRGSGRLRGRAHEIGHRLLGTNAHAASGLMRAVWSRAQLQHGDVRTGFFARRRRDKCGRQLEQRNGLDPLNAS